jgi:hypothetical protein
MASAFSGEICMDACSITYNMTSMRLCVLYVLNQATHNKLINKCNILLFSTLHSLFILCVFEHIPLFCCAAASVAAYFESQKVVSTLNVVSSILCY